MKINIKYMKVAIKENCQLVTIFNKVNSYPGFGFTATQIAGFSGLTLVTVSRFLNNKVDISATNYMKLICSMPRRFQEIYWRELVCAEPFEGRSWRKLIAMASPADIEEILSSISDRWMELATEGKVK
jgi:hypothetical protein